MTKRILVTGGSGFLGSHLCERLLKDGNEVLCLDNYFTGKKDNVIHLMQNPKFEIIRHDVTIPYLIEVDEIYNLACPASPVFYQLNPIKTIKTSILGAINMLGLAKRVGAKILQASTSEIYGNPTIHPQTEKYCGNVNPIGPRSCYDEGKRCAESLFINYYKQNNVRIKIVRIFNTYGPRMQSGDGRVVSNFIVQALKDIDLTIYGDGSQTRSFCFVDDMVEGMISMMKTSKEVVGPLNIGNPEELNMLELAEKIIKMTSSRSKIIFLPLPVDDPLQRKPEILLAQKYLNWSPKIGIEEGLIKTIDYFNKTLQIHTK